MNLKQLFTLTAVFILMILSTGPAQAVTNTFASPVQASCYLDRRDRCKIHVEPFSISLAPGQKMVRFQLIASKAGAGALTVIYDWRPDQSNPVPFSGSIFSPSPVARDFGVSCGSSYTVSLQGMDTGDASMLNLGTTNQFTCPKGTFVSYMPFTRK